MVDVLVEYSLVLYCVAEPSSSYPTSNPFSDTISSTAQHFEMARNGRSGVALHSLT